MGRKGLSKYKEFRGRKELSKYNWSLGVKRVNLASHLR